MIIFITTTFWESTTQPTIFITNRTLSIHPHHVRTLWFWWMMKLMAMTPTHMLGWLAYIMPISYTLVHGGQITLLTEWNFCGCDGMSMIHQQLWPVGSQTSLIAFSFHQCPRWCIWVPWSHRCDELHILFHLLGLESVTVLCHHYLCALKTQRIGKATTRISKLILNTFSPGKFTHSSWNL